jgi:serine phosphatase RsbU (regulator of sigma subunit)
VEIFIGYDRIEKDNEIFKIVSAIDCTGHGIPGAFMSIIAKDGFTDIVSNKKIVDPGEILHNLNRSIISTLNKESDENNAKDGMDLSLVAINENKKEIKFAGARNPLYLFRNKELTEYKGSIFSVGTMDSEDIKVEFKTETIPYQTGDVIYMFSDGMPDQFGGSKGKKFRYSRLKNVFQQIVELPMEDQKNRIIDIFAKWKGDFEQIDDVLIIGIKL